MRVQLYEQPQTFQAIQPNFLRELHQARHEDLPDPANAEDLAKLRRNALLQ